MSDQETQIRELFILTYTENSQQPCKISVSYQNNMSLPTDQSYALIHIIPDDNKTNVKTITGTYKYGTNTNDEYQFVETNAFISDIMDTEKCPGNNLREKLQIDFLNRSSEQRCNILKSDIYPGDTEIQKYINTFVGGIGLTLLTYKIASLNQDQIGKPFAPFDTCSPVETVCLNDLTINLYKYYSYLFGFIDCIPQCVLGKIWAQQVVFTWINWGRCFNTGPEYDNLVGISCTIQGYACYFEDVALDICKKFNSIDDALQEVLDKIQQSLKRACNIIDEKVEKFIERYERSLSTIISVTMMLLDILKHRFCKYKHELDCCAKYHLKQFCEYYQCCENKLNKLIHKQLQDLKQLNSDCEKQLQEKYEQYEEDLKSLHTNYQKQIQSIHNEHNENMKRYAKAHKNNLQENDKQYDDKINQKIAEHHKLLDESYQTYVGKLKMVGDESVQKYRTDIKKVLKDENVMAVVNDFLHSSEFRNSVDRMVQQRVEVVLSTKYNNLNK